MTEKVTSMVSFLPFSTLSAKTPTLAGLICQESEEMQEKHRKVSFLQNWASTSLGEQGHFRKCRKVSKGVNNVLFSVFPALSLKVGLLAGLGSQKSGKVRKCRTGVFYAHFLSFLHFLSKSGSYQGGKQRKGTFGLEGLSLVTQQAAQGHVTPLEAGLLW